MKPVKVRAAAAALGALLLMPFEASPARSWSPGEFEVFCGSSGGSTLAHYAPDRFLGMISPLRLVQFEC